VTHRSKTHHDNDCLHNDSRRLLQTVITNHGLCSIVFGVLCILLFFSHAVLVYSCLTVWFFYVYRAFMIWRSTFLAFFRFWSSNHFTSGAHPLSRVPRSFDARFIWFGWVRLLKTFLWRSFFVYDGLHDKFGWERGGGAIEKDRQDAPGRWRKSSKRSKIVVVRWVEISHCFFIFYFGKILQLIPII